MNNLFERSNFIKQFGEPLYETTKLRYYFVDSILKVYVVMQRDWCQVHQNREGDFYIEQSHSKDARPTFLHHHKEQIETMLVEQILLGQTNEVTSN